MSDAVRIDRDSVDIPLISLRARTGHPNAPAAGNARLYVKDAELFIMLSDGISMSVGGKPANHIADATGTLADIVTKFNTLLTRLENQNILKSS
jgi:hypothetical protein